MHDDGSFGEDVASRYDESLAEMFDPAAVEQGGDAIPVTIGDFARARVEGTFAVAYLVFNTINNLTTQEAQVACFHNAAAHLQPGGCFVVEVGTPSREALRVFNLTDTHVGIDQYDADTQHL